MRLEGSVWFFSGILACGLLVGASGDQSPPHGFPRIALAPSAVESDDVTAKLSLHFIDQDPDIKAKLSVVKLTHIFRSRAGNTSENLFAGKLSVANDGTEATIVARDLGLPCGAYRIGISADTLVGDVAQPITQQFEFSVWCKFSLGMIRVGASSDPKTPNTDLHQLKDPISVLVQGSVSNAAASTSELLQSPELLRFLHVRFAVSTAAVPSAVGKKAARPQIAPAQVFVGFKHAHSARYAPAFVTSVKEERTFGTNDLLYRFTVDLLSSREKCLECFIYNGSYTVTIQIADYNMRSSVRRELGTVELYFPAADPPKALPLYHRSLMHESDTALEPLPELHHTFRAPEAVISVEAGAAIALCVLVPVAIFLVRVFAIAKVNFGSPLKLVHFLVVVAIVGVVLSYWVGNSWLTFQLVLKLLCGLFSILLLLSWSIQFIGALSMPPGDSKSKID
jgi:hypothetical protein